MGNRFYFDEFAEDIFDDKIQQYPSTKTICNILNQQDQRITELEIKKEAFKKMYFDKCLECEHSIEKYREKCAEFELKEYDYKQTIFEKDQDKISFAIEQIKQIKEKIYDSKKIGIGITLGGIYDLDKIFDNQIAELTNQHK